MAAHRVRAAHLACLGAILVAAACSSACDGSSGYDNGVRDRFVAACTKASSGQAAACNAAYECIRKPPAVRRLQGCRRGRPAGRPVDPATAQVLVQCAAQSAPTAEAGSVGPA